MRHKLIAGFDLVALVGAIALAQLLRDNLEWVPERYGALLPYISATAVIALFVLPLVGTHRTIWRFSALPDYQRVVLAVSIVVVGAVAVSFIVNRLDGVSRSLPILHVMIAVALMVVMRVLFRLRHLRRRARKSTVPQLTRVDDEPVSTVLVIGINALAETYLQSLTEFDGGRFFVAGLLGRKDRHVGQLVGKYKVLGVPEDLDAVLQDLSVHGVSIDRIVVALPSAAISDDARASLFAIEDRGAIEVQFLIEALGLQNAWQRRGSSAVPAQSSVAFAVSDEQITQIARRPYWRLKRLIDIAGSLALLVLLAPAMVVVAGAVAIVIGSPVIFWQRRPGLGGTPIHLYKFRTMGAAHAPDGRLRSDEERTTWLGELLRRTRLDELPQLISILKGDMSFVGPRPLLPRDQAPGHWPRLLIRPGLTGWAQVVGGRIISADDKAALDVWYVQNANFALDVRILLRTIQMVVGGEKVSDALVDRAWRDLKALGVWGSEALERPRIQSAA